LPFDQTSTDQRSRCTPFHAFGRVAVADARLAVRKMCRLGGHLDGSAALSAALNRSAGEPVPVGTDAATGPGCRKPGHEAACRRALLSPFPSEETYYRWRRGVQNTIKCC
jgi:hypothetical protein